MEPDQDRSVAELDRLRAEFGKLEAERTKLLADARRLYNNPTLDVVKSLVAVYAAIVAGVKVAEGPGWLWEEIMLERRGHPQDGQDAYRHRWFATKLVAALAVTIIAAYWTATLL